jgi:hypothetical protein
LTLLKRLLCVLLGHDTYLRSYSRFDLREKCIRCQEADVTPKLPSLSGSAGIQPCASGGAS